MYTLIFNLHILFHFLKYILNFSKKKYQSCRLQHLADAAKIPIFLMRKKNRVVAHSIIRRSDRNSDTHTLERVKKVFVRKIGYVIYH